MASDKKCRLEKTSGCIRGFFYIPQTTRESGIFTTDGEGYIFSEFFRILADEKDMELPPLVLKHPDEAINEYLKSYGLVAVVQDQEKSIICFSSSRCNKLPTAFTDRIRTFLHLMPSDTTQWTDDVFKETQKAAASEVIYGTSPPSPPVDFDDQLRRLAKLKEEKLITEDEFNLKKRALLGI